MNWDKRTAMGISILEFNAMFPDEAAAEQWFVESRWPYCVACPDCGSVSIQRRQIRYPQPCRCRDRRKDLLVRTGTFTHDSKLGFRVWIFAIHMMSTSLKGQSSMKLRRDLGITQKSAWHLAHRIREAFEDETEYFGLPVEVDETYTGGKRRNMSNAKRREFRDVGAGRGSVGKTAVFGAKDGPSKRGKARGVEDTGKVTLQGFVADAVQPGAQVYVATFMGMPVSGCLRNGIPRHGSTQDHELHDCLATGPAPAGVDITIYGEDADGRDTHGAWDHFRCRETGRCD